MESNFPPWKKYCIKPWGWRRKGGGGGGRGGRGGRGGGGGEKGKEEERRWERNESA